VYDVGADSSVWGSRAQNVKNAFKTAYGSYAKAAFGRDELKPVRVFRCSSCWYLTVPQMSNLPIDNFNGWGVMIVDSLDTMVLMGLDVRSHSVSVPLRAHVQQDELTRAMEHVAGINVSATQQSVHFFETTIRYMGGYVRACQASQMLF
jgi:endoplasmic reticulum Man9GlcNAc2 1,2-alpha-mannosidase